MKEQKRRVQLLISDSDWRVFEQIDEENSNKLSPSQILSIIIKQYANYQKVMKRLEEENFRKEEKIRNIEYELRQKLKYMEAKV
jgi:hypothetical protein